MKRHKGIFPVTALALTALLAGCWGSDKSSSVVATGGGSVTASATAVGIDKCNNCHANSAVNGEAVFLAWSLSQHGNSNNSPSYPQSATCIPCHDPDGDSANLIGFAGSGSTPAPRNVVGCEACHGGGSLHFGVGPIGFFAKVATTGKSSQYNTCTQCHGETPLFHETSPEQLINDTHFDNGARTVGSALQGYVVRKALGTSCGECHRAHEYDLTENLQWKASAHGDFAGAGWKTYDWKLASRQSCQQCHTTTGYVNYTNNQLTYNAANNVFVAADNQSEMLYCYGCHQLGERGMLKARRAIDNAYLPVGPGRTDTSVITGLGDSILCINCHSGREPGSQVKANLAASATGPDNTSFGSFNSHYLLAGATLFQNNVFSATDNIFIGPGAYQFVGNNYAKPTSFAHDTIGGSTKGPCVGCHMTSPNVAGNYTTGTHSFLPIVRNIAGVITSITSTSCSSCHGGALTAPVLQSLEEQYQARIAELQAALETKGIYYNAAAYPYFYTSTTYTSANQFKTWETKAASLGIPAIDLVGVAYNLNYFVHEPGAYVHNSVYAARVLYDSIAKLGVAPSAPNFPSGRP